MSYSVIFYRGTEIVWYPTGWFSVFVPTVGNVKADTLEGAKAWIDEHYSEIEDWRDK